MCEVLPESNISNLKQTLLRTTLAKQSLESEKKELVRKIEDINENSNLDMRRVDKAVYNEELQVARDAISNYSPVCVVRRPLPEFPQEIHGHVRGWHPSILGLHA